MDQPGGRGRGRGGGGGRGAQQNRRRSRGGRNRRRGPKRQGSTEGDESAPNKRQEIAAASAEVRDVAMSNAPSTPVVEPSGHVGATKDPSFMTPTTFASLPDNAVHRDTTKALTGLMKLARLTEIQLKTLVACGLLPPPPGTDQKVGTNHGSGIDVLGRARTGTGKTVAFLVPAIQTIINNASRSSSVKILAISPTRELATQISVQAEALLTHHKRTYGFSCQVVYGGTNIRTDISKFNRAMPTIIVATPGRLKDHLQNTVLSSGRKFADCMNDLEVLVLDEADQLLEMGFRPDIRTIVSFLPAIRVRQTLLFSATMPKLLRSVMAESMKPDYVTVDCIHDGDGGAETNKHVKQSHIVLPSMNRIVISVLEVVMEAIRRNPRDHKIIAFFSTARLTGFFADIFNHGLNHPVVEIHSRKSQKARDRSSEQFRNSKCGILFTSDVSARGVDYPDVTKVIQFGFPDNREQYIHRLGRTGRAGRAGEGWLVLAPFERSFLRDLTTVNCPEDAELKAIFASPPNQDVVRKFEPVLSRISTSDPTLTKSAELAYQSWLGFYNGNTRRMGNISKSQLVALANEWSAFAGLPYPPALEKRTIGKMGLKGVPGLNFR